MKRDLHKKSSRSTAPVLAGALCAMTAVAIWSGNFVIARGMHTAVPPVALAFWRWVVAVAVLLPFALKGVGKDWPLIVTNLPYLALTALIGVTLFNTLIYVAGHTTTAFNLSLIAVSTPLFIVILSRLVYGEPITGRKITGLCLAGAGVVMLITGGSLSRLLGLDFAFGDLLMLLATLLFATYSILVKRKPPEMGMRSFLLSIFGLGLIFLLPLYLWEYVFVGPITFDGLTILCLLYLGIFASLIAWLLWNRAILIIGPSKTAPVYYTLPVFSGILGYLLLGERVDLIHLVSMIVICTGVLVANR